MELINKPWRVYWEKQKYEVFLEFHLLVFFLAHWEQKQLGHTLLQLKWCGNHHPTYDECLHWDIENPAPQPKIGRETKKYKL
jgi:hypothetical protein